MARVILTEQVDGVSVDNEYWIPDAEVPHINDRYEFDLFSPNDISVKIKRRYIHVYEVSKVTDLGLKGTDGGEAPEAEDPTVNH